MTDRQILEVYLGAPFCVGKNICKSPYIAAIEEARNLTGRNERTGEIIDYERIGSWSGAIIYLILIDHIGSYFTTKNSCSSAKNSFLKALEDFSNLNEIERYALYALRCSFAHEFSLINIPKDGDEKKRHKFTVNRDEDKFIKFPQATWDGNIENDDNKTIISLKKLGDLVEEMHKKIIDSFKNKQLIIVNNKSSDDLIILRM